MGKIIPVAIGCLLVVSIWYWRAHLTYTGEVSHFEAKVRSQVNPVVLQDWAVKVIAECSTSQVAETSFAIRNLPGYLQSLDSLSPFGYAFSTTSNRPGFLRIAWGSGFRGHWGLNVGDTNFVDPFGNQSEMWKPGVYFWRDSRQ